MPDRLQRIYMKFLQAIEAGCEPWGASPPFEGEPWFIGGPKGHRFRLNPPLRESAVVRTEERYGVRLPSEYRSFITRLADGGAGPSWGLFSLERALNQDDRFKPVPDDHLRTPFPHRDGVNVEEKLWPGQASSEPRPLSKEEWNALSKADQDRIVQEETHQMHLDYLYETAGTLHLCSQGCGIHILLVVTGPTRGQMWYEDRANTGHLLPLGVGFFEWYERWLDLTLEGGDGLWWSRPVRASPG